MSSILNIKDI